MNKHSLFKIAVGPAIVLVIHIIVTVTGCYERWWWFDIPMHLIGGFAMGTAAYYLLQDYERRGEFKSQSNHLTILLIIGFVALAAVSWEFLEFALDTFWHTNLQTDIIDTIKDLCMGLIGGSTAAILKVLFIRSA